MMQSKAGALQPQTPTRKEASQATEEAEGTATLNSFAQLLRDVASAVFEK